MFFLLCSALSRAQHPHHIIKDDESGLPSNEVYSIVQDEKGFIWLGSDAGLYRFNGVRYQEFKCRSQASKAISGLCFSKSGRLFCYNFKGQIFTVFKRKMSEVKHPFEGIQDITTDLSGNLVVCHTRGISVHYLKSGKWKTHNNFGVNAKFVGKTFTKSAQPFFSIGVKGIMFITTEGIGMLSNGKVKLVKHPDFRKRQLGAMILTNTENRAFVFSSAEQCVYQLQNGKLQLYENESLSALLAGRKITNIQCTSDARMWICTYSGIIEFNFQTEKAKLYYEQYSFSNLLIDRNWSYWFSTLHNGLIHVPDFRTVVWNKSTKGLRSDKITKITNSNENVFFATGNGQLGSILAKNGQLGLFETGNNADIQMLYFDEIDDCLYVSQSNMIFSLKRSKLSMVSSGIPSVKKMLHFNNLYCMASSNGLLVCRNALSSQFEIINRIWNRDLIWLDERKELWCATNEGIWIYTLSKNQLKLKKKLLANDQVLSLVYDSNHQKVYALIFDGRIVEILETGSFSVLDHLTEASQVNTLQLFHQYLFVTTSNGLYTRNLHTNSTKKWTTSDGLVANNILESCFVKGIHWLATGKGVQRFSFDFINESAKGEIYLEKFLVGGKSCNDKNKLQLVSGQGITLFPESNLISEFGNNKFLYRINGSENWSEVPGSNEQIFIPSVPEGDFEIELKLLDNYGRDSVNNITVRGYMQPPFYRRTWFFILVIALLIVVGFSAYNYQIKRLREKQKTEIERLKLEADLRITQQTALKAQMNPHFIFNVLTSIKSYIYKNDKVKAAAYLTDFSDLIRGILDMTNLQYVSLKDELDFLKVYIDLEGMMLGEDFQFELNLQDELNAEQIEIPALLIQPFIENAFKHGLHHHSGLKKLILNVSEVKNQLLIEIQDNGVGRNKSMEINANRSKVHQSFATSAIEKRIDLVNRDGKMTVDFEIIDNETIEANTTVRIRINTLI